MVTQYTGFLNMNNFIDTKQFLSMHELTGKRVAIVGAASSNVMSGVGSIIDEYDFVVKTGRAGYLNSDEYKKDFGSRCDILYTNAPFYNDNAPIDYKLLSHNGVKLMRMQFCHKADFDKAREYNISIVHVTNERVKKIRNDLQIKSYPLTGLIMLYDILLYRPSEILISGFDFFQKRKIKEKINVDGSEFVKGYASEKLLARVKKNNYYDPHDYNENKKIMIDLIKKYNVKLTENIKEYFQEE